MRVTAMLVTHDLVEESMPWMEEVRNVFDELVIFIDEKRVTPGSAQRAEEVATRVQYYKVDAWYDWDLEAMARACESDWVFIIDHDEQLSPEWRQGQWRQLLETTQFTHFWLSRRWIVQSGKYIVSDPWWPDLQLRLFKNNLEGTTFPTRLHDTIHVPGPGAYLQTLAIHHHVLWLLSRKARVEKVRHYERLRPGGGLGHLYLHENYRPPEALLPKPKSLNVNTEIQWMDELPPDDIAKVSCRMGGVPPIVRPGGLFWIDADVANMTSRPLYPLPPYPVRLAYHWIKKATRRVIVFEGHRSGLFPHVGANETMHCRMAIVAPYRPGEYILQASIVQDGVCWFDQFQPDIRREFLISVTEEVPGSGRRSPKRAQTRRRGRRVP
jgi:hypothetical protein